MSQRNHKRKPAVQLHTRTLADSDDEDDATGTDSVLPKASTFTKASLRQKHVTVGVGNTFSISHRTHQVTTSSPKKARIPAIFNDGPLNNEFTGDMAPTQAEIDEDIQDMIDRAHEWVLEDRSLKPKRVRTLMQDPLHQFVTLRDTFLSELLRIDGPGDTASLCSTCLSHEGEYRCDDCDDLRMHCQSCILQSHDSLFLHRIKKWSGSHFTKTSLKALGQRIQLGHLRGASCILPKQASNDAFVVIDTNGIHEVHLDYCGCESAEERYIQLLRMRWFPATTNNPKTAATFRVLHQFQILTFESKASAFEFYQSLHRLTDNTGVSATKDRYRSFMVMVREWRHLKMLKRAGRGHDPAGAAATGEGGLAVLCPACPQPDKNLPDGWREVSSDKAWLYMLIVGIDANFRMKRKHVSNDVRDPGLSAGWAYFVEEKAYKQHLDKYAYLSKQPSSTCQNHNAVNAERSMKGLAATGIATIDCARHDMKRPCAVGDLLKGEKFIHTDYMYFLSMRHSKVVRLVTSYDIVCQWSVNLWNRMKEYPTYMALDETVKNNIIFLIPKFHLPAHIQRCHNEYSFNYTPGVARTDGEAPERGWAHINPVATSTREMGPGHRRDTLDDHFGDWNWKKVVSMYMSLLRKMQSAVPERNDQAEQFRDFEAAFPQETVQTWQQEVKEWEAGESVQNPFESRVKVVTQTAVRRSLAEADAIAIHSGSTFALHTDISASVLVTMGLDLEEQQKRLATARGLLGPHATDHQHTTIQNQSNTLHRRIKAWIDVQHLYMPSALMLRQTPTESSSPQSEERPEVIALWLPSSLSHRTPCDARLAGIEWDLRRAQASDALDDLRHALRLRSFLYNDKDRFRRGQSQNTRSNTTIQRCEVRVQAFANTYRSARVALTSLATRLEKTNWIQEFPRLEENDVRGMTEKTLRNAEVPVARQSEGTRVLSWIWTSLGAGAQILGDEGLHDGVRIEWCKSRARATRWAEEVQLLQEEMRRVLQFMSWEAQQWDERRASSFSSGEDGVSIGRRAYASQQADLRRRMRARCEHSWRYVEQYVQTGDGALDDEEVNDSDGED